MDVLSKIVYAWKWDHLIPIAIAQELIMPPYNLDFLLKLLIANLHEFVKKSNLGLTFAAET